MNRRHWLLGGAAVAAGAAGMAWQQRREDRLASAPAATPAVAAGPATTTPAGDPAAGLWQSRFDQPGGGLLELAPLRGRPLLLNFWATWCPPCIKELPMLDAFARERAGRWNVVGLAIDREQAVRDFLARSPVGFGVGLAGISGSELMRTLGNSAGGLPFSVTFGADGAPRERKLGELTPADLEAWDRSHG